MISSLKNIIKHRSVVKEMVSFKLKVNKKSNRMGKIWWFIEPAITIMIYWMFFSIIRDTSAYYPYPVFVGCAVISFKHFSTCLQKSTTVFLSNASVLKTVPLPPLFFIFSDVILETIMATFAFVVLTLFAAILGCKITLLSLQIFPLIILQTFLVTGICMFCACIGGIIYDFNTFLPHILRMLFYLSPGFYGLDIVINKFGKYPMVYEIFTTNPLAMLFTGFRMSIWEPELIPAIWYCKLIIEIAMCWTLGVLLFLKYEKRLIKTI